MKTSLATLAMVCALGFASAAHADFPDWYFDEGDFLAQGTIHQTTDFDGYAPNTLQQLNATESFGALTLKGDPLIVIGAASYLTPVRNVIANNIINQDLLGSINPIGFNMLSFQMGNLGGFGEQVFMEVFTNLDSYAYGLYPDNGTNSLSFYGFVVPVGEYFTGFSMHTTDVDGNFEGTPIDQVFGITDIKLGSTNEICLTRVCDTGGPVPEPATWAMMILGFGATGAVMRTRRRLVGVTG
jgi:hypothetical protein